MRSELAMTQKGPACDTPNCVDAPIFQCGCPRCSREPDFTGKYHACRAHTADVGVRHRKCTERSAQWGLIDPPASVQVAVPGLAVTSSGCEVPVKLEPSVPVDLSITFTPSEPMSGPLEVRAPGVPITPLDPLERAVRVVYTNHRGETEPRRIMPVRMWYGSTPWHPEPQWLLDVHDVERRQDRTFALKDIRSWNATPTALSRW